MRRFDVRSYNRRAWDLEVQRGNPWTVPVGPDVIRRAREGDWTVVLTPVKPVPRSWFPPLAGLDVLCLAGGGGQQGPVLAAAGANVTVLDNSPMQLHQDRTVAARDDLAITLVEGDMADQASLPAAAFDLIFHPCSNCFVPEVLPVWRAAAAWLRPGGHLLSGFLNPVAFQIDKEKEGTQRTLELRFPQPYSDLLSLTDAERARYTSYDAPLEFGHSLEDQLGGQLKAGLHLVDLYEDTWGGRELIDRYLPGFFATRAVKPMPRG